MNALIDKQLGEEHDSLAPTSARDIERLDWSEWFEYYKLCRDSTHNLAQKFLSLLFQLSTFAIGSLTLVGFLREKIRAETSVAVSVVATVCTLYFVLMMWRYYRIVGALSELCWRIECRLFPATQAKDYGIFHIIDSRTSFYASQSVRRVVVAYCITLLLAEVALLGTVVLELFRA